MSRRPSGIKLPTLRKTSTQEGVDGTTTTITESITSTLRRKLTFDNNIPNDHHEDQSETIEILTDPLLLTSLGNISTGMFGSFRLLLKNVENQDSFICKVYEKSKITSQDQLNMIEHETKALKYIGFEIQSPYLESWKGSFETPDCFLILSSYDICGNLGDLLEKNVFLEESSVKIITKQVGLGLHHLHESGIAHRNLCPENIEISADGKRVVISNFENCKMLKVIRRSSSLSALLSPSSASQMKNLKSTEFTIKNVSRAKRKFEHTSTRCGSIAFQAPEMIEGKEYGVEVDSWALGVLIYLLSTGSLPFFDVKPLKMAELITRNKPDYTRIDSDECFELISRLFVCDGKRRMEIGSVEYSHHPFIHSVPADACLDASILPTKKMNVFEPSPQILEGKLQIQKLDNQSFPFSLSENEFIQIDEASLTGRIFC